MITITDIKNKVSELLNKPEVSYAIDDTKKTVSNIMIKSSDTVKSGLSRVSDSINSIDPSLNLKWGEPVNLTYYQKLYNILDKKGIQVDKKVFIEKVKDTYDDNLVLKDKSVDEVDICKVILSSTKSNGNVSIDDMTVLLNGITRLRKEIKTRSLYNGTNIKVEQEVKVDENQREENKEEVKDNSQINDEELQQAINAALEKQAQKENTVIEQVPNNEQSIMNTGETDKEVLSQFLNTLDDDDLGDLM